MVRWSRAVVSAAFLAGTLVVSASPALAAGGSFTYSLPVGRSLYLGFKEIDFTPKHSNVQVDMTLWAAPPALDASFSYCPATDGREPFYTLWVPARDGLRWVTFDRYRPTPTTCGWRSVSSTGVVHDVTSTMRRGLASVTLPLADLTTAGEPISPLSWQGQVCDVGATHGECWDYTTEQVNLGAGTGELRCDGIGGPQCAYNAYRYPYPSPGDGDCDGSGTTGCIADQWSFFQGQCTSWVAFRINVVDGIAFNNAFGGQGTWSNASLWRDHAQLLRIRWDNNPARGAIAWYSYGHVGFVEAVGSGGSFTLSEMNWDNHDGFWVHTIRKGDAHWPTAFIHIERAK